MNERGLYHYFKATFWQRTSVRIPEDTVRRQMRMIVERTLQRIRGWEFTRARIGEPQWDEDRQEWLYSLGFSLQQIQPYDASPTIVVRVVLDSARRHSQHSQEQFYEWDDAPTEDDYAVARELIRKHRQAQQVIPKSHSAPLVEDVDTDNKSTEGLIDPPLSHHVLAASEITMPDSLIEDRNAIQDHPAFRGIYGRSAHIRRGLVAIRAYSMSAKIAQATGDPDMDLVRNHVLYWGPPAAAKTRILRGIRRILPAGSFIEIDAPSLTAAGLVDIFLTTYRDHCPPIVFVDEFEKVNEKVLVKWDEMLDERASASKNTYFEKDRVKVPFLCIAACNDKDKLDKKLEGAISSRFATQIYVPKPSQEEMEVILLDQIQLMNGNPEWAQQCINFMDMFGCDDARMVKGWLSYGDGLLTGSALQDLTDILNRQRKDLGYHYEPTGNPYQDSLAELKLNHQMHHASHKNRRRRRGS